MKPSKCCNLCNNSETLKCWRSYIINNLDYNGQWVVRLEASSDQNTPDRKFVRPGNSQRQKGWRETMINYIEEQGGSYQDKKWKIEYYDEWKVIGLGNSNNH
jgi:hypothetical protein